MSSAFGGGVFLADSSAWARANEPLVADAWATALREGQIATFPIINLEILFSARDGNDFDAKAAQLAQLRNVPITRSVTSTAQAAFRELAHVRPFQHRTISLPDLLVAAAAADTGLGVLHYDSDFDTLARVLPFESRWVAARGLLS